MTALRSSVCFCDRAPAALHAKRHTAAIFKTVFTAFLHWVGKLFPGESLALLLRLCFNVDRMVNATSIVRMAGLIGEAGRIQMLSTLLDGNAHSASELAVAAAVSPQTASSHLSKLLSGGLIACERQGRQRLFRLKNRDIARASDAADVGDPLRPHLLRPSGRCPRHRLARRTRQAGSPAPGER